MIRAAQIQVQDFMQAVGQSCPSFPAVPNKQTQILRLRLHREEAVDELDAAFVANDLIAIADSIADSLVVVLGTAVACGIDIEPIFQEVMRSNMTKLIDGHRDFGGKWIKGPAYSPTNIQPLIEEQLSEL